MKRKMVNIMTTMLLISNISMNTVYASPIHLEPVPAPDMSITTETENNEHNEETNEHDTLDMHDSNDGFHDGSEGINDDGNEGYGLLEEVGGVEETSSYINLGILRLDSFLVKSMNDVYFLNNYSTKIDEIINYAKKKTKIKCFNSNNDNNISNSLNKTLDGIEYDEEKNMFYMDLEKSNGNYDGSYYKKNRTSDEKLYRVYLKLNYVYDGKRTDDVDFNYILNDIKSKNEDEIDDIKLVDDEFYGEDGYNYLNVEITDKHGNKYKSKIIIETDQNQDYDQSGNINYDKPILTEEEIKNGQISNEHYNEIRDFIKSKDIFKPKNKFYIRNSVLNIDNNYLSSQNQDDIKKTIKYFYKNQIENFQNFTLFKENGQTKVKVKFEYSNYQSNNFDKYLIVNVNNPDNETVELFDPSTIQDKQEHLYNINIKYNPNIDEINEEGFYDAGTVEIDKNLDARIYKESEGAGATIGLDTDNQIINSLKEKLNIVDNIIPTNWEDGYLKYDKNKQKFYQEYSDKSTDKKYRFYFIGTDKNYEFSDENDTKLDLTDEKNIDIVLAFIEQEYDNVKNIKLNNKNILNENNRNYLDVEVTEDNGMKRNTKIFLNPTTIKSSSDYRSINIDVTVSTEELSNRKLKKETINEINNTLNKKINNNILYKNEYFVLNDYNIYVTRYTPTEGYYINIYNIKDKVNEQIHISIGSNLTADLLLEDKDNPYNLDINNFKVSEYKQCNKYNKNTIYISKNGEIPILDYINSKLNDNLYADNLRIERFLFDDKIIADVIDKTTHEKKSIFIIHCNEFDDNNHKTFFMNTINDDLRLTDQNKKDLEKLIKNIENVNIKNIEFEEKFNKEEYIQGNKTLNYYTVNATIYFENGYSYIKTYNIMTDSIYQNENDINSLNGFVKPGLPQPMCPPSAPRYLGPPAYGGKTCSKDKKEVNIKIKIPSANDFPDITPCNPNKPNKPATPSNITPDQKPNGGGITPKPNKPSTPSTPNTVIPKESNTTPSRPSEPTPVTIINKTENKNNVNESQLATALPKQDVHQSEISRNIKTGDNMFNIGIMIIFSILGLAIYAGIEKFKKLNFKKRE